MPPVRNVAGGPLQSAGRAAAALLGVSVARAVYGRWRRMSAVERRRIEPLAEAVKEQALDLRGELDPETAGRDLREANEQLAEAIVESAAADPDVSEIEVRDLRADLARELERLAEADIRASRGPGGVTGDAPADGRPSSGPTG